MAKKPAHMGHGKCNGEHFQHSEQIYVLNDRLQSEINYQLLIQ